MRETLTVVLIAALIGAQFAFHPAAPAAQLPDGNARFETLEARVDARFETLESRLVQRLEARIGDVKHELLRWMLASWSTMMLVMLGTLFAVLRTR